MNALGTPQMVRQHRRTPPARASLLLLLAVTLVCGGANGGQGLPLDRITLPPGFEIAIYASNVPNARSMALSPSGTLFVGTRTAGDVYAIVDRDHDHKAD